MEEFQYLGKHFVHEDLREKARGKAVFTSDLKLPGPVPLLSVQGKNDTLVPISDTYLMMEKGSPKTAWINPEGMHLGISPSFPHESIKTTVILPWLRMQFSASHGDHR